MHLSTAAPALSQTTFTRYWQPFQPPPSLEDTFDTHKTHALAAALERHDVHACFVVLRAHVPALLPYPLWLSLWTLVAEGPSPIPTHGLYERLDKVCEQLYELYTFHQTAYPTRSIPSRMHQRFVYLILKRAERIEFVHEGAKRDLEWARQSSLLVRIAGDFKLLDGDLAGRVVFRLARMRAFKLLVPCLNAYIAHPSPPRDPIAAGQPLAAVLDEALQWCESTSADQAAALALGIEALRLAFVRNWPIKHTLVQRLLFLAGSDLARVCLEQAKPTPSLPSACTCSLTSSNDLAHLLREVHTLRPQYMHERAAVVLCRLGDPCAALDILATHPTPPFDVYAAAMSALTWMVRSHVSPYAALALAIQTGEALSRAGMHADEQMYGELIRAFQSIAAIRSSTLLTTRSDVEKRTTNRDVQWSTHLSAFTSAILARQDVPVIRVDHLALLLRLHIKCRQFKLARQLYEQMRLHYSDVLPCSVPSLFGWLFMHAYTRPSTVSFAMCMYQDWLAFGNALPSAHIEPYIRALLSYGMASMAHRVIRDQSTTEVPRTALASYVVRAYLANGHFEAAIAWATDLLAAPTSHGMKMNDAAYHPVPSLDLYAVCLYETCRFSHYGADSNARAHLHALFGEFQLGLAHAIAAGDVCMDTVTRAYYGMLRIEMQALGVDEQSAGPSLLNADEQQAAWDRIHALWHEWHGLTESFHGEQSSIYGDMDALYVTVQHVPRPSAAQVEGEQQDG